jgi:DNA-binding beta-propeller fold protein YncE
MRRALVMRALRAKSLATGTKEETMRRATLGLLTGLPAIVVAGAVAMQVLPTGARAPVVSLPQRPTTAVVDEQTGRAFVAVPGAEGAGSSVYVVDTTTGALVRSVGLGPGTPVAMALDQRHGRVVVLDDAASDNVQVLDATTGSVRHRAIAGIGPSALAVDERNGHAFIIARGSDSVSVLDTRSGQLLGTTGVGFAPTAIAVDEQDDRAFVATGGDGGDGQVWVFDAASGRLLRTSSVPQTSGGLLGPIVVDAQRGHVFIAGAHTVSMFDAARGHLRYPIEVGAAPVAMAVDDSTGRLLVDLSQPGIRVLDAARGRMLRRVAGVPGEVLLAMGTTAAGARVLVVDPAASALDLLDAWRGTLVRRLVVGQPNAQARAAESGTAHPVTIDRRSARIYVAVPGPREPAGPGSAALGLLLVTGPGHVVVLDVRSGATLAAPATRVTPTGLWVADRAGRVVVLDEGGQKQPADDWLQWLDRHLTWTPVPTARSRVIPPSISLLSRQAEPRSSA